MSDEFLDLEARKEGRIANYRGQVIDFLHDNESPYLALPAPTLEKLLSRVALRMEQGYSILNHNRIRYEFENLDREVIR